MDHREHRCGNSSTVLNELIYHMPYAIFSVALALGMLSVLYSVMSIEEIHSKSDILFHSFHFLHLVFASTGAFIIYLRYSSSVLRGFIVSLFSTVIFCTLSDVILPYCAGLILGVHMHIHFCFLTELQNVVPFVCVGLLNGYIVHRNAVGLWDSKVFHFAHTLVSALASLFYVVGHGLEHWYVHMGLLFILLIIAVVIPCTCADIIVPVFFAKLDKK